jgi:diguanylate cyclase (GGDEF)-like protein
MAYTDELTGIKNRAAYYREEMRCKDMVDSGKSEGVIIVNMDLNNLKMVNDIYGHDRGDHYLQAASEVLRRTFHNWGSIFRVGGDEFIALVLFEKFESGSVEENQHFLLSTLERNQELIGRREGWEHELSIAYGVSQYKNGDSDSFDDAKKRADKAMYTMKSRMKRIRRF